MVKIRVTRERGDDYRVVVEEKDGSTEHRVIASQEHVERFAPGVDPETLIEASFRFLLEREPKESILDRFELPVIARYFPEYPKEIRRRLGT